MKLDDYNLATLFRVEKVKEHIDPELKEERLRPGQPIMFGTSYIKSLFKIWEAKNVKSLGDQEDKS